MIVLAAALSSACGGDTPVAPVGSKATAPGANAVLEVSAGNRLPDLTGCEELAAEEGSTLVLQALGVGVQIYRWDGTTWKFVAPSATLYADAQEQGVVATHFGGPTWQSKSGGTVVGALKKDCTPDAGSIPWLSLTAVPAGPGVFESVNFIQRLNTVGGKAPSTPGDFVGQEVSVPYRADYLFYRA